MRYRYSRVSPFPPLRPVLGRWFVVGLLLVGLGCSKGAGPAGAGSAGAGSAGAARISPSATASQVLAEYDTNKDGALDAKELQACPALRDAVSRLDMNGDARVSADELTTRFTLHQQYEPLVLSVQVTLDGAPLDGATVTLVPEKFMGDSFKSFSAVTEASGIGTWKSSEGNKVGLPLGYYRVEVSKKNATGQEVIPAKYNAKSILGQEVAPDTEGGRTVLSRIKLVLTSR